MPAAQGAYIYSYFFGSIAVNDLWQAHLKPKETISSNCYASSNAATDVIASKVALGLRVTCIRGLSMEYSAVHNYGYFELGITFATYLHPYDQVQVLLLC